MKIQQDMTPAEVVNFMFNRLRNDIADAGVAGILSESEIVEAADLVANVVANIDAANSFKKLLVIQVTIFARHRETTRQRIRRLRDTIDLLDKTSADAIQLAGLRSELQQVEEDLYKLQPGSS